jgi:cilia- and flagella-associated protein 251
MLSVGKDRMLIEYDLEKSNYDELIIKEKIRIEQYAVPKAVVWHPTGVFKESFLLTVNDQVSSFLFFLFKLSFVSIIYFLLFILLVEI